MRLYNGDCLEVMKELPDNSVDLVLTDPPYFKVKGEDWDNQWDAPEGFLSWLDTVLEQFQRVLKANGSLYLFASPKMAAHVEVLIGKRFNVLNNIRWLKEDNGTRRHAAQIVEKDLARSYFPDWEACIFAEHYGADNYAKGEAGYQRKCDELRGFLFEPLRAYIDGERIRAGVSKAAVNRLFDGPNVGQYWWQQRNWQLPTKENYEILRDGLSRLNHNGEYLKREYEELRQEYEELRRPFSVSADVPFTDVWTFKTVNSYRGKHPCEKPADMLEHIINVSSKEGATVLDAFMGTGSTGLACQKLGREFIGIELSEKYYAQAEQRLKAQPALF